MIIHTNSQREYENTLLMLRVINELRNRGPGYHPPLVWDTPWISVRYAKEQYL